MGFWEEDQKKQKSAPSQSVDGNNYSSGDGFFEEDQANTTTAPKSDVPQPKGVGGKVKQIAKDTFGPYVGAAEGIYSTFHNMGAATLAGGAGVLAGGYELAKTRDIQKAADTATGVINEASEMMAYNPKTEHGEQVTEAINKGFEYIGSKPATWVGNKVIENGGTPERAALYHTIIEMGFPTVIFGAAGKVAKRPPPLMARMQADLAKATPAQKRLAPADVKLRSDQLKKQGELDTQLADIEGRGQRGKVATDQSVIEEPPVQPTMQRQPQSAILDASGNARPELPQTQIMEGMNTIHKGLVEKGFSTEARKAIMDQLYPDQPWENALEVEWAKESGSRIVRPGGEDVALAEQGRTNQTLPEGKQTWDVTLPTPDEKVGYGSQVSQPRMSQVFTPEEVANIKARLAEESKAKAAGEQADQTMQSGQRGKITFDENGKVIDEPIAALDQWLKELDQTVEVEHARGKQGPGDPVIEPGGNPVTKPAFPDTVQKLRSMGFAEDRIAEIVQKTIAAEPEPILYDGGGNRVSSKGVVSQTGETIIPGENALAPREPGKIIDRASFEAGIKEAFGLTDLEAKQVGAISEARARVWGKRNNKPFEDWYKERIAAIERGGEPGSSALFQEVKELKVEKMKYDPLLKEYAEEAAREMGTTDAGAYYDAIAGWIEKNAKDSKAVRTNTKTLLSIELTTDCPKRADGHPCPYCYVEIPRGQRLLWKEEGKNAPPGFGGGKPIEKIMYKDQILSMPPELVRYLNDMGGLRMYSFGDFAAWQEPHIVKILADAKQKGLIIKAITKQKEFVDKFGNHPNMRINISADGLPREFEGIGGKKVNTSNAPTIEEAWAWRNGKPNVNVRYMAMNFMDAMKAGMDNRVSVITLYHGAIGERLAKLIEYSNPYMLRELGPEGIKRFAAMFENMRHGKEAFDTIAHKFEGRACCVTGKCGTCGTCCGHKGNFAEGIRILAQEFESVRKGSVEFLDDGKAIIRGFEAADVSTAVHELGHVFRRELQGKDAAIAEGWAGAKQGVWTRAAEEKFARGFEKYLREGKAPNKGLQAVFQHFEQWLGEIYGNVRDLVRGKITPGVKGVFDRLLDEKRVKEQVVQAAQEGKPITIDSITKPQSATGGFVRIPNISWQGVIDHTPEVLKKVGTAINEFFNPFSSLTEKGFWYEDMRNLHMGRMASVSEAAKDIYAKLHGLSEQLKHDIFKTTDGKLPIDALPDEYKSLAKNLRSLNFAMGEELIARGLLDAEAAKVVRDKGGYVKYMYLRHILGDKAVNAIGMSNKMNMAELKHRVKMTEAERKAIGLIEDISITEPVGIMQALGDIAKFDLFESLANDPRAVWTPDSVDVMPKGYKRQVDAHRVGGSLKKQTGIDYTVTQFQDHLGQNRWGLAEPNGTMLMDKWSVSRLAEELNASRADARLAPNSQEVQARLRVLEQAFDEAKRNNMDQMAPPEGYTKLTGEAYGSLNGRYVRTPIARDISPVVEVRLQGAGATSKFLNGVISTSETIMAGFKVSKTAFNPPTFIANGISNFFQYNMKGTPVAEIPYRLFDGATEWANKGDIYKQAKQYGIFDRNFSAEIKELSNEFKAMQGKTFFGITEHLAKIAKVYGKIDDFYKMAIFTEEIKKGKPASEAAIQAQKWGMDYGVAHPSIKVARRFAAPFISYTYKIAPLLMETATKRPWVLAKYALIPEIMYQAVASSLDMTADDLKALKEKLPSHIKSGMRVPLPWKSPEGHVQWVDLNRYFPWNWYTTMYDDVKSGKLLEAMKDSGFGNPILDVYAVMKTTKGDTPPKDPFSGRNIYNMLDSNATKATKMGMWVYGSLAPTAFTEYGAAGYTAKIGEKDKYGRTVTPAQAAGRWTGFNIVAPTEKQGRAEKSFRLSQAKSEFRRAVKDNPNMTTAEKADLVRRYQAARQEILAQE